MDAYDNPKGRSTPEVKTGSNEDNGMDSFEKGQAMFPSIHRGTHYVAPEHDTLHHVSYADGAVERHAEAASSHAPYAKIHTHTEKHI